LWVRTRALPRVSIHGPQILALKGQNRFVDHRLIADYSAPALQGGKTSAILTTNLGKRDSIPGLFLSGNLRQVLHPGLDRDRLDYLD
jgi:hypothetical protein